jgi:hypothetical protein
LRKFGATRPAAFRTSESFSPLIASGHPANMRRKRAGSSQYPCHKQTDPLPVFGGVSVIYRLPQSSEGPHL